MGAGPSDDGAGIASWCENQGRGSDFVQHVIGNSPEYVKDIVGIRNSNSAPSGIYRHTIRSRRGNRRAHHPVTGGRVRTFGLCFPENRWLLDRSERQP